MSNMGEVLTQPAIDKLFDGLRKISPRGKRVLVADDSYFMRLTVRDILNQNDYEVVADAKNGYEVIEATKETDPDIIIMDIVMPEMDGLSALKKIKQIKVDVAVVICSSMATHQMVLEAINSGASWFIIKPFIPEQFMECINKL